MARINWRDLFQFGDHLSGQFVTQLEELEDAASAVPAGGTTGQVLEKASNADYDTEWASGGGSQPVRMESKAVAYNTANIKVSDGGVVFFTAEAGEFLTDAAAPIVLTTPFNGSSPTFVLFAQGDDPTNTGNYLSTLVLAGTTVTAVGTKASRLVGASNFQSTGLPCVFSAQTVVMIAFGDGSGGDDDSTAGAATVVLPVWTAA